MTDLLAYAKEKTHLHADRSVSRGGITGNIGKSGFLINYVAGGSDCRVELYIQLDKEKSKQAFAELIKSKTEIEKIFGEPLVWQELPDRNSCRVRKDLDGGYRFPPETWPETHKQMTDAMIRLDKAMRPFVTKIKIN